MPKGTALWITIGLVVVAIIAILLVTNVISLPWHWH